MLRETSTYQQIIKNLLALESFLLRLDLSTEASRLRVHIEVIQTLEAGRLYGNIDHIANAQTRWSMTEATELAAIHSALSVDPPKELAKKLQLILKGPSQPQQETTDSNLARNTAFELALGAKIHTNGVAVHFPDNPDISCDVRGTRVFIQCKRPFEEKGVDRNIQRALRQLKDDFETADGPAAVGVVAISLSRIV